MTVNLNGISNAIDCLDVELEWLKRMALTPLAGKYYNLFCITVYANGCHEWGLSANLRVSDRRIYIRLHEMEAHGDTLPKAVYLHFAALRNLTESLEQAATEVQRHFNESGETYRPIGGDAISVVSFEQSVRAALMHDS